MARFNILFLALAACLMLSSSSRAVEAREIVAQEGVLLVGSNKLEWGIRSVDSGYFYFHRPSTNLTDVWEFAPCTRAQLSELKAEDLRCDFFGPNDLGGPVAFSKNWQERSIIINHRDLLLARVSS